MLWGSHAQKKAARVPGLLDGRHLVLNPIPARCRPIMGGLAAVIFQRRMNFSFLWRAIRWIGLRNDFGEYGVS
jgi:hypothetical protein